MKYDYLVVGAVFAGSMRAEHVISDLNKEFEF